MTDARYHGVDDHGRPYTVTAATAQQDGPERVNLTTPKGDITLQNGTWLMVQSKLGVYLQHSGQLDLSDGGHAVPRRRHHAGHRQRLGRPEERRRRQRRADPRRRSVRHPRRAGLHRHRQGHRHPVRRSGAPGPEWIIAMTARATAMTARSAILGTALVMAVVVAGGRARAQQLDLSHGGPIDITASDGIEWRQDQREVIARGNARAVRGNVTVIGDRLIAFYRPRPVRRRRLRRPSPAPRPIPRPAATRSIGSRPRAMCRSSPPPTRRRATTRSTTSTRRCW